MQTRDIEFLLSQYVDGALSPVEAAEVERALDADAGLRQSLADYQKLNSALRSLPLPAVRWDALAEHISSQIAAPANQQVENYPMPWLVAVRRYFTLGSAIRFAAAAMVLLAAFVGWRDYAFRHVDSPRALPAIAKFVGPEAEVASGPTELNVQIGGPAAADKDSSWQASPVVITPTRLVIAAGGSADRDMLGFAH